jgi:hypothetical protein
MTAVEGWAILKALAHPRIALERLQFRRRAHKTCPVVDAILSQGRRIPEDRAAWLERLASTHPDQIGSAPVDGRRRAAG